MGRRSISVGSKRLSRSNAVGLSTNLNSAVAGARTCIHCNKIVQQSTRDVPWICEQCLMMPTIKCLQSIIFWHGKQIELLELRLSEKISSLENEMNEMKASPKPGTRPAKRMRTNSEIPVNSIDIPNNQIFSDTNTTEISEVFTVRPPNELHSPNKEAPAQAIPLPSVSRSNAVWVTPSKKNELNRARDHPVKNSNVKLVRQTPLELICTNIAEPTATTLKMRQLEELSQWQHLCQLMALQVTPESIVRMTRHPSTPHTDQPRLLKVTLRSEKDLEDVLLSSYVLVNACKSRIYQNRTWSERQQLKTEPKVVRADDNKRAVFIHGVPETKHQSEMENMKNDLEEWKFIQELLGFPEILTVGLIRLPSSANYRGTGPKILKVSLATSEMVTKVLQTWSKKCKHLPSELRIRPFKPKPHSSVVETEQPMQADPSPPIDHAQPNVPAKNVHLPIPQGSA